MSNQESMFADQEQQPESGQQSYKPQGVNADSLHQASKQEPLQAPSQQGEYQEGYAGNNTDPREQPQWQGGYAEPGSQQWNAGKIYPQSRPPRRRRARWGWIIVAVLVFIFAFGGMISYGVSSAFNAMPHSSASFVTQAPRTFIVNNARPTLDVNVNAATVHIHTGSGTSVTVEASTPSDQPVESTQQGNTINVQEQGRSGLPMGDKNANVDITAPAGTDIQLKAGAGEIDINGINGQVNVNTGAGAINVNQSTLSGQSSLHTGVGAIKFNGSLDPTGSYRMDTGVGSVDVTLPANAAFDLTGDSNISNDFGSRTVGNASQPSLDLHSGLGKVSLHKGA